MTEQQYCTFFVNGLCFGVEVRKIQEVLRFQEMTSVPLAPPVIAGLINLRGQIVTAVDLRRRLGLPDRAPDALPMNVVVRQDDTAISLLVDEIGDVLEVSQDTFEQTPRTLKSVARELVRGVYKLDKRLLLILDIERAVDVASASGSGKRETN
jgi:purine-binding chemotaxis protein CheW